MIQWCVRAPMRIASCSPHIQEISPAEEAQNMGGRRRPNSRRQQRVNVRHGRKAVSSPLWGKIYNMEVNLCRGTIRIGAGSINALKAEENGEYQFGGREIRIDRAISYGEYVSGKCYGRGSVSSPATIRTNSVKTSSGATPLTSSKLSIPYKTPLKPVDKRAIDLHPVNLLSTRDPASAGSGSSKLKAPATYWTANW